MPTNVASKKFLLLQEISHKGLGPQLVTLSGRGGTLIRCSLVAVLSHWGQAFLGAVRHSLLFVFSFFFLFCPEVSGFILSSTVCQVVLASPQTQEQGPRLETSKTVGQRKLFPQKMRMYIKKIFYNLDKNYFKRITSNYAINISL